MTDPVPMFRRTFHLEPGFQSAVLEVCGLGYGKYYLNGKPVTEDLFISPPSDYRKTLWYTRYIVTDLLTDGNNLAAAMLGNGFYNETIPTVWEFHLAPWRDQPKFAFRLEVSYPDKTYILESDPLWKCSHNGPVRFSQLRSGETWDSRLYDPAWTTEHYDDSYWDHAVSDTTPPTGIFRLCQCQPIRECAAYPAKKIVKTGESRYVVDIGQNISGYIRLSVCQESGSQITIRYAEAINPDWSLQLFRMDNPDLYPCSPLQTDRLITNGQPITWSPQFVYHGFRYIELDGLEKEPLLSDVQGIFVHQVLTETSGFSCSDPTLNQLFRIGQMATLSNVFYMPTDCPTREKLGWANDARASTEQFLLDFDMEPLLRKWFVDVCDSIREDGAIPGIIPTGGFGYDICNGPLCSGVLFEIPYQIYRYTGNTDLLTQSIPQFQKQLDYILSNIGEDGLIGFGLCDWAGPFLGEDGMTKWDGSPVPVTLSDTALYIHFLDITILATELASSPLALEYRKEHTRILNIFKSAFLSADGTCTCDEQSALALIIAFNLFDDLEPLKRQLMSQIEAHQFHHNCGMLGLRHLYEALDMCDLQEYAYRILTATGFPSYFDMINEWGATTLCESWQHNFSLNHHMYSSYMVWMLQNLVGIQPVKETPLFRACRIKPYFPANLNWCSGYVDTPQGRITVRWERMENGEIKLDVSLPDGCQRIE